MKKLLVTEKTASRLAYNNINFSLAFILNKRRHRKLDCFLVFFLICVCFFVFLLLFDAQEDFAAGVACGKDKMALNDS